MRTQARAIDWLVSLLKNCPASYRHDRAAGNWVAGAGYLIPAANIYDWPKPAASLLMARVIPVAAPGYHDSTLVRQRLDPVSDYIHIEIYHAVGRSRTLNRTGFRRQITQADTISRCLMAAIPRNRSDQIGVYNDGWSFESGRLISRILVCFHTEDIPAPLPDPPA